MTRTARSTLPLLLLLASASCSATALRQAKLKRGLDDYAYPRSVAEVWPEVQRLANERGYPLVGSDRKAVGLEARNRLLEAFSPGFDTRTRATGGRILETGAGDGGVRLRAEAFPTGSGGCRVVFTQLKRDDTNPALQLESRDLDLELALLQRVDPVAAARIEGVAPPAGAVAAAAAPDAWTPVRHLVGTWESKASGAMPALKWAFDFPPGGQRLELHGSAVLGPSGGTAEEMGIITRDPVRGKLVWRQFTASGQVNEYLLDKPDPEKLVFTTEKAESLPPGARARLTLGRDGPDELVAVFEQAEPGKDFAVTGEARLVRQR